MKIYTKTGDAGDTGLFGGARVAKDDQRVAAYGDLDELNSVIGMARALPLPAMVEALCLPLQAELFVLGAELATVPSKTAKLPIQPLGTDAAARLERAIDEMEAQLTPLQSFILPGGTQAAALLHHARTVCRRAERSVVRLHHSEPVRTEVLVYLNRLSDFLFVLARYANHVAGMADVPWAPRT